MTGSSGRQRVPAESLSHVQIVVVPKPIAEMRGKAIAPVIARASKAAEEPRTLVALRDPLLPKLISEKLRWTNAEDLLQETTI